MKYRLMAICLSLCLLASCAPRSASASSEEVSASSSEESSVASAVETKKLTPEEVAPKPSSSEAQEEEEEYPVPILTDTEKELLQAGLDVFVYFIGGQELASPSTLSKEVVLASCIGDIQQNAALNAYFFEQDKDKNDLIPGNMIADKAMQLFGIEGFAATESASYNSDKECYVATKTEIPKVEASPVRGAPDDQIAYTVTIDGTEYVYTGKIYRVNGMPYLRLTSITK